MNAPGILVELPLQGSIRRYGKDDGRAAGIDGAVRTKADVAEARTWDIDNPFEPAVRTPRHRGGPWGQ